MRSKHLMRRSRHLPVIQPASPFPISRYWSEVTEVMIPWCLCFGYSGCYSVELLCKVLPLRFQVFPPDAFFCSRGPCWEITLEFFECLLPIMYTYCIFSVPSFKSKCGFLQKSKCCQQTVKVNITLVSGEGGKHVDMACRQTTWC